MKLSLDSQALAAAILGAHSTMRTHVGKHHFGVLLIYYNCDLTLPTSTSTRSSHAKQIGPL